MGTIDGVKSQSGLGQGSESPWKGSASLFPPGWAGVVSAPPDSRLI